MAMWDLPSASSCKTRQSGRSFNQYVAIEECHHRTLRLDDALLAQLTEFFHNGLARNACPICDLLLGDRGFHPNDTVSHAPKPSIELE